MTSSEFDLPRQHVISFREEPVPPCWVTRRDAAKTGHGSAPNLGLGLWQSDETAAFRSELIEAIQAAKGMVCVSSFLFADRELIRALLNAADRGVRVYILTAAETFLLKESRGDGEFEQERLEEHKRMLNELAGRVLMRTAGDLHAKFVLIDAAGRVPKGFLLTGNLTKEGFDRNPEFMVELSREEVRDLFRMFLIGFWREGDRELLEPGRLRSTKPAPPIELKLPESVPCTLGDGRTLKESLRSMIQRAGRTITVSTFGIDRDHEITQSLLGALKDGRELRVLTKPKRPTNMPSLVALAQAGAEVRGQKWLHAKALVVDTPKGREAIVTTANLRKQGLDEGFEAGIPLRNERADAVFHALEDWWARFPSTLRLNAKRGDLVGDVMLWENERLTERTIAERYEKDLGSFEAPSIEVMENYVPPFPQPPSGESTILYLEHLFRWTVTAPRLPTGAQREKGDHPLPVFRRGRDLFVAITSRSQLEQAQELARKLGARVVAGG